MGTRLTAGEPLKAVVTGGNRGLGLEIVRLILVNAPGSRVFLGCRNMDEGEKLAALFRDEGYLGEVTPVLLDVTSGESIGAARKTVGDCVPHLDLLVNNAGKSALHVYITQRINAAPDVTLQMRALFRLIVKLRLLPFATADAVSGVLYEEWSPESARQTMRVNFEGVVSGVDFACQF
jgi:NAD(P)-dependent dehydrogenase (short-subunit alcohol dehydrogenase family)